MTPREIRAEFIKTDKQSTPENERWFRLALLLAKSSDTPKRAKKRCKPTETPVE